MITTNLTLTNGVTSETPVVVTGITLQAQSKLIVDPVIIFPLTVAIDSSEIIGIDFDETLYSGDHTELVTINTLGGVNDIIHTVNIEDTSTVPTTIDDFEAVNGSGQITFSWTNSTATPTATYNIFENNVEIATDVDQAYVRIVAAGTYVYRVEASNMNGDVPSNSNLGISTQVPSDILDFAAADGVEVATMTFTPATGHPIPRHQLYEDDVEVVGANNIASGYIHTQTTAGTYSYRVEAYNLVGSPVTSNSDDAVVSEGTPALVPPSAITDFAATDLDVGSITMTWTDATGNPTPTYALYENNVAVVGAEDISDGYVHTVGAGTYTYRVDAINSEDTVPSNDEDGTSVAAPSNPNLVINGTFDTDSDWDIGTNWNISGGALNSIGDNVDSATEQIIPIADDELYTLTFDITEIIGDSRLNVYNGEGGYVLLLSGLDAVGSYTVDFSREAGADAIGIVFYSNTFEGSIDNVELRRTAIGESDFDFEAGRVPEFITVARGTGTTYYFDFTNGDDGDDGLTPETAKKTMLHLREIDYPAGTNILFKRGESWLAERIINYYYTSGVDGNPIYYGNYGEETDPLPIISEYNDIGGTWILTGDITNEWVSDLTGKAYGRMWKNGAELLKARSASQVDDDVSAVQPWKMGKSASDDFNYDDLLYVYSETDPNLDLYEASEGSAIYTNDQDYINIDGINFKSGINIDGTSSNCHIANNECGAHAMYGIDLHINNSLVEQNVCDSEFTLDYSFLPPDGTGADAIGSQDGLALWQGDNNVIRNNDFIDWSHSSLAMSVGTNSCTHNELYQNTGIATNATYGGRWGWSGDGCNNNEFHHNLLTDVPTRSQLGGQDNHVHHNIIEFMRGNNVKGTNMGQGIQLEAYGGTITRNVYEYNIMRDCTGAGIDIETYGADGSTTLFDNVFNRNLIQRCGTDLVHTYEGGIGISANANHNDFINNVIEQDSVVVETVEMDVATFNLEPRMTGNTTSE